MVMQNEITPSTHQVKVLGVGSSVGIVIPKAILERLQLKKGDSLIVTETPDGIMLTPYDPEFAEQMAIAEDVMRRRKNMLRKLAE